MRNTTTFILFAILIGLFFTSCKKETPNSIVGKWSYSVKNNTSGKLYSSSSIYIIDDSKIIEKRVNGEVYEFPYKYSHPIINVYPGQTYVVFRITKNEMEWEKINDASTTYLYKRIE